MLSFLYISFASMLYGAYLGILIELFLRSFKIVNSALEIPCKSLGPRLSVNLTKRFSAIIKLIFFRLRVA